MLLEALWLLESPCSKGCNAAMEDFPAPTEFWAQQNTLSPRGKKWYQAPSPAGPVQSKFLLHLDVRKTQKSRAAVSHVRLFEDVPTTLLCATPGNLGCGLQTLLTNPLMYRPQTTQKPEGTEPPPCAMKDADKFFQEGRRCYASAQAAVLLCLQQENWFCWILVALWGSRVGSPEKAGIFLSLKKHQGRHMQRWNALAGVSGQQSIIWLAFSLHLSSPQLLN